MVGPSDRSLDAVRSRVIRALATPILLAWLGVIAGCASATLRSARDEIAAGHYATAHQHLLTARNEPNLSSYHRREIDDDLCLTEEKIGAPSYPVAEQLSACERASSEGAGQSGKILTEIRESQRETLKKAIDSAIAAGDVARALDGIARYKTNAGSDPNQITTWSKELWAVIDREDDSTARARHAALRAAIVELARTYPKVHRMSDQVFSSWIQKNTTVGGARMISGVEVSKQTLMLHLPDDQLSAAAINLDLFAKVNDAMVVRCGCDGRTKVALQDTQLPAYLVQLDPATHRSEVLVLARF